MSITTADATVKGQWDYLVTTLRQEILPGKRLSTVKYVGAAYDLWYPDSPSIGVQLYQSTWVEGPSMQRTMSSEFWILLGMQSTDDSAGANISENAPANLEDAMNQLREIVVPANGQGLMAVLTDLNNYALGGFANKSMPAMLKYMWTVSPGANPQIWAYAHIVFTAKAFVTLQ